MASTQNTPAFIEKQRYGKKKKKVIKKIKRKSKNYG